MKNYGEDSVKLAQVDYKKCQACSKCTARKTCRTKALIKMGPEEQAIVKPSDYHHICMYRLRRPRKTMSHLPHRWTIRASGGHEYLYVHPLLELQEMIKGLRRSTVTPRRCPQYRIQ